MPATALEVTAADVLAWARHVRSGGTTAWADFWPDAPAGSGGGPLPGATQLELVDLLESAISGATLPSLEARVNKMLGL